VMGGLFVLGFFTLHFVGFHTVHAEFLNSFFPLGGGDWGGSRSVQLHGRALFSEVARRYWVYLPAAFLAERAAFFRPAAGARTPGSVMMLPYQKVMRMHMLIFFFAFAHFAGLDNFAVYAVVYAVYFFPWRLLKRSAPTAQTTPA
jgi:hypothetical protein